MALESAQQEYSSNLKYFLNILPYSSSFHLDFLWQSESAQNIDQFVFDSRNEQENFVYWTFVFIFPFEEDCLQGYWHIPFLLHQ